MHSKLRAAGRLCRVLFLFLTAYLDFVFRIWLPGRTGSIAARAGWLQFWAIRFSRIVRLEIRRVGNPPAAGLIASNHLSYLDVLVLASQQQAVFVSKSEVARWPIMGRLTRCAGTLYIDRRKKSDVHRLTAEMARVVDAGVPLVMFLEGTSSDGSQVLPFHSSLLEPAARAGWPATGAWIQYTLRDGSVANEVCYWRDMTFGPHLFNLLGKAGIEAVVHYGQTLPGGRERKQLALELHAQVRALKSGGENQARPVTPAVSQAA